MPNRRHHCSRSQVIAERAHAMRINMTPSEARLWEALRGSKLGVAFRRQVPIGHYIVDFLAPSARLIVEVDGGYHAERASADARRDRALERAGYRVVRVSAERVMREFGAVVAEIRAVLQVMTSKSSAASRARRSAHRCFV